MLVCNDCINMVVRVKEIEMECSVLASHLVLASSFEGAAVTDILLLLLAIYSSVNSKLRVILHVATRRILPHVASRYQQKYQYHFKSLLRVRVHVYTLQEGLQTKI
jgi:hypothetical protein